MRNKIILFLISFFVWCLLTWVPDWQHILIGIIASVFVTFLAKDLFIERPSQLRHPKRYWYFIVEYLPVFFLEIIKANFDVAMRVLHPRLPINPGIVRVKTRLKSDTALTFLANSITLTPGTMTVDIDRENGILYIHWIDVKAEDVNKATKIIVERFERILSKIFD